MKQRNFAPRQPTVFGRPHRDHSPSEFELGRPAVLFALFEEGQPTASLRRAFAHARMLDAELHVRRVLPERTSLNVLFPQGNADDTLLDTERALRVDKATREWLCSSLGSGAPAAEQFAIVHGDFVDQVAQQAAALGAALIVIPPCERSIGGMITVLACTSGVPVLLAREEKGGRTIIAATDLEDDDEPVLHQTSDLALRLVAPVLAVHNLGWAEVPKNDSVDCATGLSDEGFGESRASRLAQFARELPTDTQAIVHRDESPVEAILQEAKNHDADLIVVGTRTRSWLGGLVDSSVAERVVDRARRSVLVLPLDETVLTCLAPTGHA